MNWCLKSKSLMIIFWDTMYMNANCLVINRDNTPLFSNQATHGCLTIHAETKSTFTSDSITYLGIKIQNTLKWNKYIKDGTNNLCKQLKRRIKSLKLIAWVSYFETRREIANEIFLTKLLCTEHVGQVYYLVKRLQWPSARVRKDNDL